MSAYLTWVHDSVDTYFASLSLKAMLLETYTYDVAHQFRDDITAFEIAGTGYTAGGIAVTGVVITQDDTNRQVTIDFTDPAFGTLNLDPFVAIAIYVDTGSAATDTLIGVDIFGEVITDGSDSFTYIVGDDGFITLEV